MYEYYIDNVLYLGMYCVPRYTCRHNPRLLDGAPTPRHARTDLLVSLPASTTPTTLKADSYDLHMLLLEGYYI